MRLIEQPRLWLRRIALVSSISIYIYIKIYSDIIQDSLRGRYGVVVEITGLKAVPGRLKCEIFQSRNDLQMSLIVSPESRRMFPN